LRDFKSGRIMQMVATDVASRGIHVDDIGLVVNYDFPQQVEDYIHRIGRTGRAGKKGSSVTFFTQQDGKKAKALIKILNDAGQPVPHELQQIGSRNFYGGGNRRYGGGNRGGQRGGGGRKFKIEGRGGSGGGFRKRSDGNDRYQPY